MGYLPLELLEWGRVPSLLAVYVLKPLPILSPEIDISSCYTHSFHP